MNLLLLLTVVGGTKIIKNIDIPSCKNCIFFNPRWSDDLFLSSSLHKCNKFGTKDIISDKIKYDYAYSCRNDEKKCGKEGKYFVTENNTKGKLLKQSRIRNSPDTFLSSSIILRLLIVIIQKLDVNLGILCLLLLNIENRNSVIPFFLLFLLENYKKYLNNQD